MSQRAFGEKSGLSFQYISKLENNLVARPSIVTAIQVAQATGISVQNVLKLVPDLEFPIQSGESTFRVIREQDQQISDEMLQLFVAYRRADPEIKKAVRIMLKMEK